MDTTQAIRQIAFVSGIYSIYSSSLYLSIRSIFINGGLMDWKIYSTGLKHNHPHRVFRLVMSNFSLVLATRLLLGVLLSTTVLFTNLQGLLAAIPIVLFLSDVAIIKRFHGGLSGAADMSFIVNFSLIVLTIFYQYESVQALALYFIAGQGILSYVIAGAAKISGSSWRNGEALKKIFSTDSWGDDRIYNMMQRFPKLQYLGSWSIIFFEISFPIVLFVDLRISLLIFGVGILFHIANSVLMGINGFLYIFPSTYPAIYFVNQSIDFEINLPVLF